MRKTGRPRNAPLTVIFNLDGIRIHDDAIGGALLQRLHGRCSGRRGAVCQEMAEICRELYPEGAGTARINCKPDFFVP
jgi:hypothetical protein